MKNVKFGIINSLKAKSVARDIRHYHGWFYKLVDALGVRFCCINMGRLGFYDIPKDYHFYETDMEELDSWPRHYRRQIYINI
jgi:hypothetical protein